MEATGRSQSREAVAALKVIATGTKGRGQVREQLETPTPLG